jgi:uncharacterized protein (TIGR02444 family)
MVIRSRSSPESPTGAFWRFSLAFYQRPGVAAACLDLQDRFGRDVNLLLFACWVGISGRGRLSVADFASAEAQLEPWRRSVVEPLRTVRRLVKEESDSGELHAALQAVELKAERHSQNRLETLVPAAGQGPETRLDDALANLTLYLGRGAALGASAPIRMALATEASQQD